MKGNSSVWVGQWLRDLMRGFIGGSEQLAGLGTEDIVALTSTQIAV